MPNETFVDRQGSMRRMERRTAEKTTLTCLPPNVVAVPAPSWRTTSLLSTHCGTPNASSAGSATQLLVMHPESLVNPLS